MAKSTINTLSDRVLSELRIARTRGRTCEEITNRYDLNRGSVSTKLSQLVNSGMVTESTQTRLNSRNVPVTVYTLPTYAS